MTQADDQPVLPGMPRRLYPCTPTRLNTWLDCPRRYRMSYLDRPPPSKGPPWAHNSLGASVHNALAGWWRLPLARRTVAAAGDRLNGGWIDQGYASDAQSAQWRESAHGMVERYTETLDPATEPLGVERTVGARTEQIVLSGRVDRLDERRGPGGDRVLAVVDYKTGRRPLTQDDARTSMPLALYALAAARMFHAKVCLDDPLLGEALTAEALEWATTRGARSGRVAWQYVQDLAGRLGVPLKEKTAARKS